MRKPIIFVFVIVSIVAGGAVYYFSRPTAKLQSEKRSLPTPEILISRENPQTRTTEEAPVVIKEELNLDVPFTSQAPLANWDTSHEEACEEASALMANRYFQGRKINDDVDAERGIQDIIAWEKQNLGFFESTTAQETARVAREMLGLKTEIIKNPSTDDIKKKLNENKLLLVPSAGRQLGNPFYKSPGPLYHMLVIKGYTTSKFITNDSGTKNGADYPYEYQKLLDANHDWNNGDVVNGARAMIVIWK